MLLKEEPMVESKEKTSAEERSWKDYIAPAAGTAAALGTYALARRFRPSAVPSLRNLQEAARGKKFEIATARPEGRGIRTLLFGAKDVPASARAAGEEGAGVLGRVKSRVFGYAKDRPQSVVLAHTPGGGTATAPGVGINTGALPGALDDKYLFSQIMTKGTGGGPGMSGAVPETQLLGETLKRVGGDPAKLKRVFEDRGFVIKPRTGSMSKAEDLLTEATPLSDPRLQQALKNPKEFIIQEKIPIQKEFRVHMINNVPFTVSHRELPHKGLRGLWNKYMGGGGGAFVPVVGKQRRELKEFTAKATEHIGRTPEGKSLLGKQESVHQALDVARLPNGELRIIESNPTPGTLMNPVVSRKLQRMVTGRDPRDVAAIKALGAGALTTGAASEALGAKKTAQVNIIRGMRRRVLRRVSE
jgi:hypothetical protein